MVTLLVISVNGKPDSRAGGPTGQAGRAATARTAGRGPATARVLAAVAPDSFVIHVSSSVVHSVVEDAYVRTKTRQEFLVRQSGLAWCVVRPTLMFGWFDGKHLGWLARFMNRVPVFPIPGHGRYMRQPLFSRDFCRVLMAVMRQRPTGQSFDLTGPDEITYVDIIHAIRELQASRTLVVHLPYAVFDGLLRVYALFSNKPPFTSDQLRSLVAGDMFEGVDMQETFGVAPTPFRDALRETLTHPVYSSVVIESPH